VEATSSDFNDCFLLPPNPRKTHGGIAPALAYSELGLTNRYPSPLSIPGDNITNTEYSLFQSHLPLAGLSNRSSNNAIDLISSSNAQVGPNMLPSIGSLWYGATLYLPFYFPPLLLPIFHL
jgi:hypothetical protein